ncbi:uncharacterized protein Dana_GF27753 [Drosophila ananassae]|uniref:Uncharacterized protein n=1 Tax=Drosophila ananassae TaxID=7217 RepID=A0A0P8XV48_DROAN|nr:uncharacterized protein LOC26514120 [Drosophila ananassae]KPU73207.1 uncharacterized protein Dana_GF27753 [Drosophila ananassae]
MCESLPEIDPKDVTCCLGVINLIFGMVATLFWFSFIVLYIFRLDLKELEGGKVPSIITLQGLVILILCFQVCGILSGALLLVGIQRENPLLLVLGRIFGFVFAIANFFVGYIIIYGLLSIYIIRYKRILDGTAPILACTNI